MARNWEAVRGFEQVVAVRIETSEFSDRLDPTGWTSAFDEDDEVNRFRDQPARNGRDRFLD
jgi:hypothetical protein